MLGNDHNAPIPWCVYRTTKGYNKTVCPGEVPAADNRQDLGNLRHLVKLVRKNQQNRLLVVHALRSDQGTSDIHRHSASDQLPACSR